MAYIICHDKLMTITIVTKIFTITNGNYNPNLFGLTRFRKEFSVCA